MSRIEALKISCPTPAKASAIAPAKAATSEAPTTPTATPGGDDEPAAAHAPRHRHDDADDEAGLDDFAKDDDQRAQHLQFLIVAPTGPDHCVTRKPSVVDSW